MYSQCIPPLHPLHFLHFTHFTPFTFHTLYRALELKALKGRKYLDALCVYFWATTPVLISILTFATYVAMGNTLTAAKVFTSVALFSVLVSPLNAFPWVVNGLVEAWVSLRRVSRFLQLSELTDYYTPPHEKVEMASICTCVVCRTFHSVL